MAPEYQAWAIEISKVNTMQVLDTSTLLSALACAVLCKMYPDIPCFLIYRALFLPPRGKSGFYSICTLYICLLRAMTQLAQLVF